MSTFYTNNVWKAFPDLKVEPVDGPYFDRSASRVIQGWLGTGTHAGPLDTPPLAPTGRQFRFHLWEMFEFRDGLMSRVVQEWNTADFMRQLGALPGVPDARG